MSRYSETESIFNLIPKEVVAPVKEPMYHSKYDPLAPTVGSTFGCKGTTRLLGAGMPVSKEGSLFGPKSALEKTDPKDYLRKSATEIIAPSEFKYQDRVKPAVPKGTEVVVLKHAPPKNFLTANAVEAILQVPKQIVKQEPDYLRKEDYGKVPAYLGQVKEEIKREKEMIDAYVKARMGIDDNEQEEYEELPEEDRQQMINALKEKWDLCNSQYQKQAHLVNLDTVGKKRRKAELESQLKSLEKDIADLSRNGPILIRR